MIGMNANFILMSFAERGSDMFGFLLAVEDCQVFVSIQFLELEFRVPRGAGGLW